MFDAGGPAVVALRAVDASELARWIRKIPFKEWPQQAELGDGQLRPAMVTDPGWHRFYMESDGLVETIMRWFPGCTSTQRMLSVVMPGHTIPRHVDDQSDRWHCRIHVPLRTNQGSVFVANGAHYHMIEGMAYAVDTKAEHQIENRGISPRIHFMFDVMR